MGMERSTICHRKTALWRLMARVVAFLLAVGGVVTCLVPTHPPVGAQQRRIVQVWPDRSVGITSVPLQGLTRNAATELLPFGVYVPLDGEEVLGRTYLHFPLEVFPPGTTIIQATLYAYVDTGTGTGEGTFGVYQVLDSWEAEDWGGDLGSWPRVQSQPVQTTSIQVDVLTPTVPSYVPPPIVPSTPSEPTYAPIESPTSTPTSTPTRTPKPTTTTEATATATPSPTGTPTITPTATPTGTVTVTATITLTPTVSTTPDGSAMSIETSETEVPTQRFFIGALAWNGPEEQGGAAGFHRRGLKRYQAATPTPTAPVSPLSPLPTPTPEPGLLTTPSPSPAPTPTQPVEEGSGPEGVLGEVSGVWLTWDVTSLMRDWIAGSGPDAGLALGPAPFPDAGAEESDGPLVARWFTAEDPETEPYVIVDTQVEPITPTPMPILPPAGGRIGRHTAGVLLMGAALLILVLIGRRQ